MASQREDEIRASNDEFYRAFRERDVDAMDALWARRAPVACMHPGMDVIVGRPEVMKSWRGILGHESAPRLQCARVRVHMLGESAYVTCLEGTAGDRPALIATNVFIREDGLWRMVHHQAAPLSVRVPHEPLGKAPGSRTLN
jgi:ketosteroid isomerase-like protein